MIFTSNVEESNRWFTCRRMSVAILLKIGARTWNGRAKIWVAINQQCTVSLGDEGGASTGREEEEEEEMRRGEERVFRRFRRPVARWPTKPASFSTWFRAVRDKWLSRYARVAGASLNLNGKIRARALNPFGWILVYLSYRRDINWF